MAATDRSPAAVILLALVTACGAACGRSQAAAQMPEAQRPEGQVWLTPQQVRDAKIEVEDYLDHDIDDTILTSGTISLDDVRTGHVFSPVTGRVLTVVGQLGQRVHKGDSLAVIESPDVGSAVSDVHKAEADLI